MLKNVRNVDMLLALVAGAFLLAFAGPMSWAEGALVGLVAALLFHSASRISKLEQDVWNLRVRMLQCEEGKLPTAWGVGIENRLDQSERLHDIDIERIERRLP